MLNIRKITVSTVASIALGITGFFLATASSNAVADSPWGSPRPVILADDSPWGSPQPNISAASTNDDDSPWG
jgi:hypothetical protein